MKCVGLLITFSLLHITQSAQLPPFLDCPSSRFTWPFKGLTRRCCTDERLPNGCECFDISKKSDFTNTIFFAKPQCPDELGVEFRLFTKSNVNYPVVLRADDTSIEASPFVGSKLTKFIIHGWQDNGSDPLIIQMKNAFLETGDMNVIIVDWKEGASKINYYQSATNTRSVGAMVAKLIQVMKKDYSLQLKDVHVIGHSLGAQTSGYVGAEIRRLENQAVGRITGLDPANLAFENFSDNVHVDSGDADFVDVIHTDAEPLYKTGLGTKNKVGTVDFFVNGGSNQPGCPKNALGFLSLLTYKGDIIKLICSHIRALSYFVSSIKTCKFLPPSGDPDCVMGLHTSTSCTGVHNTTTTSTPPFC